MIILQLQDGKHFKKDELYNERYEIKKQMKDGLIVLPAYMKLLYVGEKENIFLQNEGTKKTYILPIGYHILKNKNTDNVVVANISIQCNTIDLYIYQSNTEYHYDDFSQFFKEWEVIDD